MPPKSSATHLSRGSEANANVVPGGPSVVFDEETDSIVSRERSPLPSQIAIEQGKVLTRQKPKFHNVQDLDLALHQAIEGKITAKNAWASREASDLLEGIIHTIESTLEGAGSSTDDYSGFAKAATVVEGCSKVWTSRVDSTYNQSNQMVRRLLRSDKTVDNDGAEDGEENENEEGETRAADERKKKKKKTAVRTIALDPKEINLDRKGKAALTQTGLSAQFRAITEKFDQGNAHGLLIHNAPLGGHGNFILDVDYAKPEYNVPKAKSSSARSSRGSGKVAPVEEAAPAVVADAYIDMEPEDLPTFTPVMEEDMIGNRSSAVLPSARASTTAVDPLLAVNHMKEERAETLANSLNASRRASPERLSQNATYENDDDNDNYAGDWGGEDGYSGDGTPDAGAEARLLASGVREVQHMDNILSTQLALEAEDPDAWCLLTQQSANPLLQSRGELSKLRKGHHLSISAGGETQPVKRVKKDKTVVFKLEEDQQYEDLPLDPTEALRILKRGADGPLKQSATLTKNITPLGKEIVVDKEAPHAAASYTQSAVQRRCAEQAGLLLTTPPVPGETIPDHFPYPVGINDFFQMFCTKAPQWNMLRKSAQGQLIDSLHGGSRLSTGGRMTATGEEGPAYQDMPVEFFPGGGEEDYYDMGDGPEDDGGDGEIYRNNMQIISQFDLQHAEQSMRQSRVTVGSAASGEMTLMEPLEMAQMLKPMEATTPNQVDVARLRGSMWTALQTHAGQNAHIAMEGMDDPRHKDEERMTGRKGRSPSPQAMLKQNAAKVLLERKNQNILTGGKRGRVEDDDEESQEEEDSQAPERKMEELPHFSDVVKSVLPIVPTLSSTGTLSPAFFFFSILFLANEHNVLLENVDSLDDLVVRGFAKVVS
ncbi:hypothetical protein AGDE_13647 [Angomonas deanei]|nr:hypothetical protein AGDE_13647 [Angomonas deanei]|eukprot:EPY21944.1 hypothetical protein AGDE_13647 [Angomonas deanei]